MKKILFYTIALFLFFSCVKKEVELSTLNSETIDPSFAFPLGDIKLELGRVQEELSNQFLQLNPTTNVMEFIVTDQTVFDLGMSDIFNFPNQTFNSAMSMPSGTAAAFNTAGAGGSANFSSNSTSNLSLSGGEQIDSLVVDLGNLNITLSSTFRHDAVVTITIPDFKKNGVSFSKTLNLNYTTSTPVIASSSDVFDGYALDLTDGGTTNNTIKINYSTVMTNSGLPVTGTEQISFALGLNITSIERVKGYFGNTMISVKDSNDFSELKNSFSGGISFRDPRLELTTYNMTGVSFDANFTSITMPNNAVNKNLGGPGLTSHPTILKASSIGDTTKTTHIIDNSNTSPQLYLLLEEKPDLVVFSANMQLNPSGVNQNFLTKESRVWVKSKVVLPLNAKVSSFTLNDTSSLSMKDLFGIGTSDVDKVKNILIRIIADNALPIETKLQAYFIDSNNVVIDSLFDLGSKDLLPAANVNFTVPTSHVDYGKVSSSNRNIIDISISNAKYKKLLDNNQSKIIYKATTATVGIGTSKYVKFTPSDYVKLKIGAKIDFNLELK